MKKLLAGLAVLLTASITGCFAVHALDPAASRRGHAGGASAAAPILFADLQRCHVRALPRRSLTTTSS